MRDAFATALHEAGQEFDNLFFLVADISPAASLDAFRAQFPSRLVDVGVSEQTMIGMAAGLALRGFRPFTYTIANFTIYRPFEQVRVDLCYQNLPVVLVGVGGGMSYSALGGTHHTIEDVAVMGALPNMTILAPCDPLEVRDSVFASLTLDGPTYLRLGKAGEPAITADAPEPFQFGKIRQISAGDDAAIVGYGPILKMAVDAAAQWKAAGKGNAAVFSAHTMKPFDRDGIRSILERFDTVITLEEHVALGGLGAQTTGVAHESKSKARVVTFALQDEFIHRYGSQDDLRAAHGITVENIVAALEKKG